MRRDLISIGDMKFELCIMDINDYILRNITLLEDEYLEYYVGSKEKTVEFIITTESDTEDDSLYNSYFLLDYNFKENMGEVYEEVGNYLSGRAILEIENKLMLYSIILSK